MAQVEKALYSTRIDVLTKIPFFNLPSFLPTTTREDDVSKYRWSFGREYPDLLRNNPFLHSLQLNATPIDRIKEALHLKIGLNNTEVQKMAHDVFIVLPNKILLDDMNLPYPKPQVPTLYDKGISNR